MNAAKSHLRHETAAEWIARLHSEERSQDDVDAFREWLAADEAHARQFESASQIWDDMGGLKGEIRRVPLPRHKAMSRRAVLAGGGALILGAGTYAAFAPTAAHAYETGLGEQRRVNLADGSQLLLDTNSRLLVSMDDERRHVELVRGRMYCSIAADPRPFVIDADSRTITARSGRFDVRSEENRFALVSQDGEALLTHETASEGRQTLSVRPGERLQADKRGFQRDRPEVSEVMAWQSGRVVFRGDTLAEAVAEMNRYSERQIVPQSPEVAALRISGVYRVGDNAAFARTLCEFLPLEVDLGTSRIVLSEK